MAAACSLVAEFMRENEEICRRVYERMKFVNEELYKITDETVLRQNRVLFMYGRTISDFLTFLKRQSQKSLIKRLASNRKVVDAIQDFHSDMDELFKLLNIVHMVEMAKWKQEWEEDRKRIHQQMADILANGQSIHAEIQSSGSTLKEGLAMIKYELEHKKEQNDPEQLKLMHKAFKTVVRTSKAKVPVVPEWFISSDDVEFDAKDQFDCGSYGSVHRGVWGKGAKVVIKCLLMDDDQAMKSFIKEVDVWNKLSNPHIVKLFGACHVSTPAFFVCEDAIHGNLADYLMEDKSEKVVHGDLKCNNIVIGGDDKAKICDFGFSYIRSQSVGLSAKAQTDTVRWKAPECLMPMGESDADAAHNPRFASDVYSFGMCIVEAFSDEPPYALDDDDTILEKVFSGEEYHRPEGLKDDEWQLVQRLTEPDWDKRIGISAAIDELQRFAERQKDAHQATQECPSCSMNVLAGFKFCSKCGSPLGERGAALA
ncbi:protein kinase [Phytophthora infestans T30-4]|uniref:Protein kinase n=1 Tax=Phytophthora infestans (strain T30-4) TaxID=403677 RepID=D0N1B2_PHYIT|nr:protein kinase [Phytophthora infestans T30-4]EEY67425.1 protein kinase [Phytophthora infestans T30-4]|eukprot:XP_002906073.1 protein kinase [Phytophthora infestans T30-4]